MIIRLVLLILMMLLSSCMGEKVAVVEKGTQADLSIADGLSVSFDDTLLSKTTEKTIVLTHSGRLDIFDLSGVEFSDESPFQFAGGTGYPGLGGDCADHIQSGESCSIVLSFTPDTERDWFDTLTINYNNGIGPTKKIIKLKGYGGNVAKLEVSATAIEMGLLEPNSTARQNFTITNSGGLTAEELDLTLLGSSYYSIVESTCSDKLARKKSCVVTVEYSPEVIATHMAEILISYVNPETEKDLSVSFTGYCVSVEAEIRILGAATYDFGSAPVGKKLTNQFTITNAGYLDAYDIHVPAQGPYALESSSCPERLKPKESCKLVINFKPTIAGDDDRLFNIQYESGKSLRNATITLEGKGVPPALIIFTQASPYNFGVKGVGDSVEITLMIGNLGGFIATNVVTTLPVDPFIVTLNTCTDSMDIGYTCMIKLKYQPTVVGVSSDQIKFEYFDGGANKQYSR